jgi:hypothetical protein
MRALLQSKYDEARLRKLVLRIRYPCLKRVRPTSPGGLTNG